MYYDLVGYFRGMGTDQYTRGIYTAKKGSTNKGMEVIFSPNGTCDWGYRIQFLNEHYYGDDPKICGSGLKLPEIFISKVQIEQNYYKKQVKVLTEEPIASYCAQNKDINCPDCNFKVTGYKGKWSCANTTCGFNYTRDSISTILKSSSFDDWYSGNTIDDMEFMSSNSSNSDVTRTDINKQFHDQLQQWY
jgi:hypothetical protein